MKGDRLACMVYVSPDGTSRKVSRKIAALPEERGWRTSELDLVKADVAVSAVSRWEEQCTRYYF